MAHRDREWREPFRSGRAHIVLSLSLQHGGAGKSGIDCDVEQREREGGKNHVAGTVDQQIEAAEVRADRGSAAARQPAQLDGKQQDQHQADPEARYRVEQRDHDRDQTIRPSAGECRHHDAKRDAAGKGDDERGCHQGHRAGQSLTDDIGDRKIVAR
ncbi:hypothetical protein chiPu_0032814 [Chiloscyllium punctatum]|uniref:Uncharacterized protein n=1 Tax=Chiloscyllium punctatum TaxID=137246 RepID=A0A401U0L1_CHIPU|nr:hypothetical protein [Chiloscyllium punctatum]